MPYDTFGSCWNLKTKFIFYLLISLLMLAGPYQGFFFGGGGEGCLAKVFFRGVGNAKKTFKHATKTCLYSFLLRSYELDKHFRGGSNPEPPPLWIPPCMPDNI